MYEISTPNGCDGQQICDSIEETGSCDCTMDSMGQYRKQDHVLYHGATGEGVEHVEEDKASEGHGCVPGSDHLVFHLQRAGERQERRENGNHRKIDEGSFYP